MFCVVFAAVCWVLDQVFCGFWNRTVNLQLHSWWHVLMSLSAHYAMLFEIILRYKISGTDIKLKGQVVLFADINNHSY